MGTGSVDVTIRGAGVFGLSCAWVMLGRGARVRVIDPQGVGAGASGGIVGALAPHVPDNWNDKKAFQLDSLFMSGAFWGGVAAASGRDPGYARSGRLQWVPDDVALNLARARVATAADLWRGQAEWQVVPATGGDWEPASASGYLIHDTLSGRIHPAAACAALADAIRARGGEITRDGVEQGVILHATGAAGLEDLNRLTGRVIGTAVKGQAALMRHDAADRAHLFVDGVHIVPHADGTTAIGSTSEREFADPVATDSQLDAVIERARAAVPALRDAVVVRRWAGLRPRARSRSPLLGAWPGKPGHFIANGGFKIGFGMAPKVAEVMADLVLEGRDAIPAGFRLG